MMKKLVLAALVVAVVFHVFFVVKSCQTADVFRQAKKDYAMFLAIVEKEHEDHLAAIANANATMAKQDAKISELNQTVSEYKARIDGLSVQLDKLLAEEPQTTPEIEAMPIVINLRQQVKTLTEMFSLAQKTIEEKDRVIAAWEEKFYIQVKVSESWEKQYDNEHLLRVQCESMFRLCERKSRSNSLWATVGKYGLPVAAGIFIALTK